MDSFLSQIEDVKTVALIDADLVEGGTRHPNLALMKISAYLKNKSKSIDFLFESDAYEKSKKYDAVFVSKVFSFTKVPDDLLDRGNVYCGGTGFYSEKAPDLPDVIEHHMPDYDLYTPFVERGIDKGRSRAWFADYLDYSIGFLTRGCFRKCDFCVNKKYDHAFPHSPLDEFLDQKRPYIYLWDDNFFACSEWESLLEQLERSGKPFQFRQGLDIRLLTEKKARLLSRARYRGDMIFAFDYIEDRAVIEKKLKLWRRCSSRGTRLYVLCAFDSQDAKDIENTFERIRILMKYGCLPYIMRFENYKDSDFRGMYTQLARWCNQPQFFKKKSFRQFCEANQEYAANKERPCSALKAMLDFEEDYPEIAAKYFDLRFEEENMFGEYVYYFNRYSEDCFFCEESNDTWDVLLKSKKNDLIARDYITGSLQLECLSQSEKHCLADIEKAAKFLVDALLGTSLDYLLGALCEEEAYDYISPSNIPQFSDFSVATEEVPSLLVKEKSGLSYEEVGIFLDNGATKTELARKKYGENHVKTAAALGLACLKTSPKTGWIATPSAIGEIAGTLSRDDQKKLLARLCLRIPVIRAALKDAINQVVDIEDYLLSLSKTTATRRKSNVMAIIRFVEQNSPQDSVTRRAAENIRSGHVAS